MVGGGVKVRAMEGALASEDVREMSAGGGAGSSASSLPSASARGERGPEAKTQNPKGTEQEKAKADSTARDAVKRT